MQNAPLEHSAILSTFIKLPFVIKIFVLSILEWPLKTDFTVLLLFQKRNALEESNQLELRVSALDEDIEDMETSDEEEILVSHSIE